MLMPAPDADELIERSQPALRADLPQPGTGLSPTAAGAWLVLAILLVVVVGGPIYWSCSQFAQVPTPETELQLTSRLQSKPSSKC
jgi:hypothetical protein